MPFYYYVIKSKVVEIGKTRILLDTLSLSVVMRIIIKEYIIFVLGCYIRRIVNYLLYWLS